MTLTQVGWKEWIALPQLGLPAIDAKIDTGAKTSAIHAFELDVFEHPDGLYVRFSLHPDRRDTSYAVSCELPVIDRRMVRDSGGHGEMRFVARTLLHLGSDFWPIEVTLTNRENMAYRMLLGREALRDRVLVNPAKAHLLGRPKLPIPLQPTAQPTSPQATQEESTRNEHRHFVP